MVEQLRVDPATPGPRRDDDHRHANPDAVRTGGVIRVTGEDLVGRRRGRQALCPRLRRRCRHEVVKEAAVLVIGDEQGHPAPDRGVGGEDVHDPRDVPGPEVRLPVRVLGVGLGRDDPGHLGQSAALHVRAEVAQQPVGVAVLVDDGGTGLGLVGQRRPG